MSYRIGSFNINQLSDSQQDKRGQDNSSGKDLDKIADIIYKQNSQASERFDIIALQEVFGSENALSSITRKLGLNWEYVVVDSRASGPKKELYAFIWDNTKFRLKKPEKEKAMGSFCIDSRGNSLIFNDEGFARKPCCIVFESVRGFFEIAIICVHLWYGSITGGADLQKRREEFERLAKEVYPRFADSASTNGSRPTYTVMLGDYNLNINNGPNNSPFIDRGHTPPSKFHSIVIDETRGRIIRTVQYEKTTLQIEKNPTTGSELGRYASNFDHFSYDEGQFDGIGVEVERVDAVGKFYKNDFEQYKKDVSDHVPIKLTLTLN